MPSWIRSFASFWLILVLALMAFGFAPHQRDFRVKIHVLDKTGSAVIGARAWLYRRQSRLFDIFESTTDANGYATFGGPDDPITEGGDYDLTVYGAGAKPSRATINIKKYGDKTQFEMDIQVERKPGSRERPLANVGRHILERRAESRLLTIEVMGQQADGQTAPLEGATVLAPGLAASRTEKSGQIEVYHNYPMGETVTVMADADGYSTAEATFVVGAGQSLLTTQNDRVVITLKRNTPGKFMVIEFEVLDHDTDRPVKGATVNIKHQPIDTNKNPEFAGDPFFAKTDKDGKARIRLDLDLSGTFTAFAQAAGYANARSLINTELLVPSDTPRLITLYLSQSTAPWAGTWIDNGNASSTLTISGDVNRLTANAKWVPDETGGSEDHYTVSKVIDSHHVKGESHGSYHDRYKTIETHYSFELTLAGDTIQATYVGLDRTFNWKDGLRHPDSDSNVCVPGRVITTTYARKK